MRLKRALACLLAAGGSVLALPAPAAAAGGTQLALTLAERWQTSQQGAWAPYVATVRNDGGADFTGAVLLSPPDPARGTTAGWPQYRAAITVPRGAERSVTIYVLDAPGGYSARLVDAAGHIVIDSVAAAGFAGSYAVGVLSDQPQAARKIEALQPLAALTSGLRVSRFASAQAFPANAVYLSGLHALVVDDFDVSTLSDAQLRAVRDFVGLGGNLVVTGGAAWRRTILPLAERALGGLRPQRTEQVSLQPLADLAGRTSAFAAPVAAGERQGGRVVLGSPSGPPLAVESAYGAGSVLELAFDPLDAAFGADEGGLAQLAWSFALNRELLSASPAGSRSQTAVAGLPGAKPLPAALPRMAPVDLYGVLADAPAGQAPPIGLLGGLLVFYVLLAGPLSYLALKAAGRRELLWAAIPAIAAVFTGGAYAAGTQIHGAGYFDSQVQLLRVGPDGVVEQHGYHGVFSPRRGDFTVGLPANSLATTVVTMYGPPQAAVVDTGRTTRVEVKAAAYSSMRTIQTLSVGRAPAVPALGVEAHLAMARGRIAGTLKNTGDRSLRGVRLVSGGGQVAVLAEELPPHGSLSVDAQLAEPAAPGPLLGAGGKGQPGTAKGDLVLRFAAAQGVTGQPADLALVALTDTVPELSVSGRALNRSGVAALLQPVALEASDAVLAPRAQLVAGSGGSPWHRDVYDLYLPAGYSGMPAASIATGVTTAAPEGTVRSAEAYDWDAGAWTPIPLRGSAINPGQAVAALPPGAYRAGIVRLRIDEGGPTRGINPAVGLVDR